MQQLCQHGTSSGWSVARPARQHQQPHHPLVGHVPQSSARQQQPQRQQRSAPLRRQPSSSCSRQPVVVRAEAKAAAPPRASKVGQRLGAAYSEDSNMPDWHKGRRAGVILHPTSLPGPHGIGELGGEAFKFIDWLDQAGMQCWQVRARHTHTNTHHTHNAAWTEVPRFSSGDEVGQLAAHSPTAHCRSRCQRVQAHPAHVSAEQQDRRRQHQTHQWSLRCGVHIAELQLLLCPTLPAQVLPLVPPDPEYYSPYSGLDTNCGNPLLIDLAALITEGLLDPTDTPPVMPDGDVQFEKVSSQQLSRARVRVQHTA